jgi:hypothetical protein
VAQIFRPSADLTLRLVVLGVLFAVAVGLLVWHASLRSGPGLQDPVDQPVPFSHQHHVAEVGLDCRYCHTSVEESSFAGFPPTHTCMTCHSQLFRTTPMLAPVRNSLAQDKPMRWTRVHDLPDFAFFDHAVHIHKGIGCSSCHGQVDRMQLTAREKPLTMRWCLDCHRPPERYLRPREEVFDMDWHPPADQGAKGKDLLAQYRIQSGRMADCSVCHR